jgi:hypothetical protein
MKFSVKTYKTGIFIPEINMNCHSHEKRSLNLKWINRIMLDWGYTWSHRMDKGGKPRTILCRQIRKGITQWTRNGPAGGQKEEKPGLSYSDSEEKCNIEPQQYRWQFSSNHPKRYFSFCPDKPLGN